MSFRLEIVTCGMGPYTELKILSVKQLMRKLLTKFLFEMDEQR